MVHLHRGELTRANTWRQHLDATTNWAVVTPSVTISVAFSQSWDAGLSLSEIWEGWTKNMCLGMQDRLGLSALGGIIALLGAFGIPLWWGIILANLSHSGCLPSLIMILEWAIFSVYLGVYWVRVARACNINPWYGCSLPLGSGIFAGMMMVSVIHVLLGRGVTWKDRRYP